MSYTYRYIAYKNSLQMWNSDATNDMQLYCDLTLSLFSIYDNLNIITI